MAGIEARGFLVAAAVAYATGTGVVPVRKAGKLPWRTRLGRVRAGVRRGDVEVHEDAFAAGQAGAGGRRRAGHRRHPAAAADLVDRAGGELVGVSVLLELTALGGRDRLADLDVRTVLAG